MKRHPRFVSVRPLVILTYEKEEEVEPLCFIYLENTKGTAFKYWSARVYKEASGTFTYWYKPVYGRIHKSEQSKGQKKFPSKHDALRFFIDQYLSKLKRGYEIKGVSIDNVGLLSLKEKTTIKDLTLFEKFIKLAYKNRGVYDMSVLDFAKVADELEVPPLPKAPSNEKAEARMTLDEIMKKRQKEAIF
jgi:hypothetical protein